MHRESGICACEDRDPPYVDAMSRPSISVDVISDVACPWCYLGKRRLERAVSLVSDVDVAVRWRPFRLDPTIPPGGISRKDYIVRKFGSLEAVGKAHAQLEAFGRAEGIDFHFDLIERSADTTNAHRLIRWAAADVKEDAVVERLFAAYFAEGKDIGNASILAATAGEAGLDAESIGARLATDEDRRAVAAEIEEAYRIGVTGVPCFIVGRRYAVVGAQPGETIAAAIRRAASEVDVPVAPAVP
jgi:predicted DsbA family dithiol-disulfide isomerase